MLALRWPSQIQRDGDFSRINPGSIVDDRVLALARWWNRLVRRAPLFKRISLLGNAAGMVKASD